jgi:hypothetical protein
VKDEHKGQNFNTGNKIPFKDWTSTSADSLKKTCTLHESKVTSLIEILAGFFTFRQQKIIFFNIAMRVETRSNPAK